ncbi:MAG: hypothetical protein GY736_19885, partial [Sphingomonas sp.]|uniref:choice-of-anchor Q domain-containing protein n=1 Tax=Sphingomonas sp. TaxID=28214 RepID=UPI00258B63EE
DGDVLIAGVAIVDGRSSIGGGILNFGRLELNDCALRSNTTNTNDGHERGGAIANRAGSSVDAVLIIRRCAIESNIAGREAGGIDNFSVGSRDAMLEVHDSTIAGNFARHFGGGVAVYQNATGVAKATFTNTTLAFNSVLQLQGGAIDAFGTNGTDGVVIDMTYCTVSGNTALHGGGVAVAAGRLRLLNTIMAGNTALGYGGDVYAGAGADVVLSGGALVGALWLDAGASVEESATNNAGGTDASPLTVLMGTFGYHGGPTRTLPLVDGSIAIDNGVHVQGFETDQRGMARSF